MTQDMLEKMIRYHFQDRKYDACVRMLVQEKCSIEKTLKHWKKQPKSYRRKQMTLQCRTELKLISTLISMTGGIISTAIGN